MAFKIDCFAYKDNECLALKNLSCDGCRFYKTQTQVDKERQASKDRLIKMGKSELINYYKN
jgi:hypothetical protein